jgi:hypothetical protein
MPGKDPSSEPYEQSLSPPCPFSAPYFANILAGLPSSRAPEPIASQNLRLEARVDSDGHHGEIFGCRC